MYNMNRMKEGRKAGSVILLTEANVTHIPGRERFILPLQGSKEDNGNGLSDIVG
jgi:hypothetical protein